MVDKAPDAFRTISEVAAELGVPQHVLRFWESRFGQIRPLKRAGGRRYYRPEDIELLRGIQHLLYGEGYTIRGVQRILRENGPRHVAAIGRGGAEAAAALAAVPARGEDEDGGSPMFDFDEDEVVDERPAPRPRSPVPPAVAAPPRHEHDDPRRERDEPVVAEALPAEPLPRDIRPDDEPDDAHRSAPFRFLDRLKGEARGHDGGGALSRDDVRHLQETLFELLECKRLLDQAR